MSFFNINPKLVQVSNYYYDVKYDHVKENLMSFRVHLTSIPIMMQMYDIVKINQTQASIL